MSTDFDGIDISQREESWVDSKIDYYLGKSYFDVYYATSPYSRAKYKFATICDLFKNININQSIIYANSIKRVEDLQQQLIKSNFTVSAIHSKMSQDIRRAIMKDFKSGKTRVLIATDLLARGIDITKITLVINYDLPRNIENYLHRIGRSGRFGKRGTAINFITQRDFHILRDIETHYSIKIDPMPKIASVALATAKQKSYAF